MPTHLRPAVQPSSTSEAQTINAALKFKDSIWPRVIAILVSLVLFVLACISPVIIPHHGNVLYGWELLQIGWIGSYTLCVAWWANPLLLLSMFSL
jgi:hypothetical protein